MTDKETGEGHEYPYWRDAIAGDAIINLRCGAKYLLWQGSYALFAGVMMVVAGGLYGAQKLTANTKETVVKASNSERVQSGAESVDQSIRSASRNAKEYELTGKQVKWLKRAVAGLIALGLIGGGATLIWLLYVHSSAIIDFLFFMGNGIVRILIWIVTRLIPGLLLIALTFGMVAGAMYLFNWVIGSVVGAVIAVFSDEPELSEGTRKERRSEGRDRAARKVASVGGSAKRDVKETVRAGAKKTVNTGKAANRKASEKSHEVKEKGGAVSVAAQNTPGVRRVYGECPVSKEITPRWYEKYRGFLAERFDIEDEEEEDDEDKGNGYHQPPRPRSSTPDQ